MNEAARLMLVALVAAVVLGLDNPTPDPSPNSKSEFGEGSRWTRKGNVWSCWRTA